jgi:hypothetical protein
MEIKTKIRVITVPFFNKKINMNIYDYKEYMNDNDEGKDLISFCLERDLCWEPYQSELAKEILECGDQLCIDIGSHLGTYSIISSIYGNRTIAIDGNKNVNNIFRKTIRDNNLLRINVLDLYITKDTKLENIIKDEHIRLLKVDVGGEEYDVYNVFKSKFENKEIDYAIFEITTKYIERYKFVQELHKMGYQVFDIGLSPQRKLLEDTEYLYSEELKACKITGKFDKRIKKLPDGQSNFLFKSDKIMNEKCKCGANMNVFNKV